MDIVRKQKKERTLPLVHWYIHILSIAHLNLRKDCDKLKKGLYIGYAGGGIAADVHGLTHEEACEYLNSKLRSRRVLLSVCQVYS